jgi:hypothetical protein
MHRVAMGLCLWASLALAANAQPSSTPRQLAYCKGVVDRWLTDITPTPFEVTGPDGQVHTFPYGTTDEEIESAMAARYPNVKGGRLTHPQAAAAQPVGSTMPSDQPLQDIAASQCRESWHGRHTTREACVSAMVESWRDFLQPVFGRYVNDLRIEMIGTLLDRNTVTLQLDRKRLGIPQPLDHDQATLNLDRNDSTFQLATIVLSERDGSRDAHSIRSDILAGYAEYNKKCANQSRCVIDYIGQQQPLAAKVFRCVLLSYEFQ